MIRRKTKTYRKKMALLTDLQRRRSIRFSLYVRAWSYAAVPLFSYVNGWA